MRVRNLLNKILLPSGYAISKCRDIPNFTETRVFQSMVSRLYPPKIIVDVGANVGQSAHLFARSFPESQIYSLEPFQTTFVQLQANVQIYKNIRPFRLAAGSQCELREAFLYSEVASQVNSLVDNQQRSLRDNAAQAESIQVITLDRFCLDHSIDAISILKTDTEGYDLEVLRGATGLLEEQKIKSIICEVGLENDVCHTNFFRVAEFLKDYAMNAVGFYDTYYHADGRFSHTNALFALHAQPCLG